MKEKVIKSISVGPDGSVIPVYEENMRESEQEDFGPGSRTGKENDKKNLYPSEYEAKHPKCPDLKNLTPEETEQFEREWREFIKKREESNESTDKE